LAMLLQQHRPRAKTSDERRTRSRPIQVGVANLPDLAMMVVEAKSQRPGDAVLGTTIRFFWETDATAKPDVELEVPW